MRSFHDRYLALADGLGLITPQCLISIESALDLTSFRRWYDLDEHGHDYTCPERPTERVEQVSQETERFPWQRCQENVSTNMRSQTNHEADRKALVQNALPRNGLPQLRYMLLHPFQDPFIREQGWNTLRFITFGHCRTS